MSISIGNPNYLPKDTQEIIPSEVDESFNFLLVYNLPKVTSEHGKPKITINEAIEGFRWNSNFIKSISTRHDHSIENLKNCGFSTDSVSSIMNWRMVIGLGAAHPQETSMTLHHIYGIPYIPGSAVKGVTRHWFILKTFDELKINEFSQISCLEKILENSDDEDNKISEETFKKKFTTKRIVPDDILYNFFTSKKDVVNLYRDIFGKQGNAGKVLFFDAYPVGEIKLKMDIMNPHYPKYYSGNEPPADYQDPNPIKFLTVENTEYRFHIASKNPGLLKKAKSYLIEALREHGIGAKTAIGYGYFGI